MAAKYALYTFFMAAATGLTIAPTVLSFDPFENTLADAACEKDVMMTLRAFSIIGCVFAGLGFIMGLVSLAKPMKVPALALAICTFLFTIPSWAIAAHNWGDGTSPKCFLKDFPMPFLPLFVSATGAALIAIIVLLAMADAADASADAGNVEADKKEEEKKQDEAPQEVKSGDDQQTPQPKEDDSQKQKDEEEAAAAKKKAEDDEAAAKQKAADEEAQRQRQAQAQADADAQQKAAQEEADRKAAADKEEADRKAADEAAAAQKQKEDEEAAAAAKKKAEEEELAAAEAAKQKAAQESEEEEARRQAADAANKKKKVDIDWKTINAKLPFDKKNMEQKKLRFEMFDTIDVNKTGKVSLLEVTAGMVTVLGLGEEIDVPVVIQTAFNKAKVAGQQAGVNEDASGGDFIEKNEFRLFLMYTRMYFEMFQLFSELDETGDMMIELGEFEKAIPLLKTWGAKIEDAGETFKQIDKNGGGKVLFAEFVDWALSPEQNLDCPDEDE